jgi:hypothetical protein
VGLSFLLVVLLATPRQESSPGELLGVVLDEAGRAVAQAVVIARGEGRKAAFEKPRVAHTDGKGRFRLELGSAETFAVTVFAPGFAVSSKEKVSAGEALRFELSRGLSVSGVVRDARTREPVAGARLESSALPRGAQEASFIPDFGKSVVESDARGRFRLTGLPPGPVYVSASARGYARLDVRAPGDGEELSIFLFHGGGSLSGVVLSPSGEPLAGASVVALTRGNESMVRWSWGPGTRTDSKGRFEVLGLGAGTYRVLACHPGAGFRILPEVRIGDTEVSVDEVRLPEGQRISGRLVDEEGEPLVGEVRVETLDGEWPPHFLSDRTHGRSDARGEFELEKLAPGEYTVLAQAIGYPGERVTVVLEGEGGVDLGPIAFGDGLGISGVVVDTAGGAVSGAQVAASRKPEPMEELFGGETESASTETADDGSFRLRGLEEGSFRLFAGAPGYQEDEPVTVEAGAADVVLVLERGGAIAGTVVGENGKAIVGYHVLAETDRSYRRRRRDSPSSIDGRFQLGELGPGEYSITVMAEGRKPERLSRIPVKAGETTEVGTVVLRSGGRIRGTVSNPEGAPVAGASVALASSFLGTSTTSDARGAFVLAGLEEGVVTLRVSHPEYADAVVRDLELRSEREPVEVKVELGRGGAIEGLVRDRDGSPVPGRSVRLERRFGGDETATTGPDGTFRWERLPPGLHRIALLSADPNVAVRVQERQVDVEEGETTRVVFDSRRIVVSGYVTKGGVSVSGARVSFEPVGASGGYWWMAPGSSQPATGPIGLNAVTGPEGFYELYAEGPGEYRVEVTSSDGPSFPEKRILLPDRESHELDLSFDTLTVSGKVVSEESETAVSGAWVLVLSLDATPVERHVGSYRTEENGTFFLELEPGRYRIRVRADGFSTEETAVELLEGSVPELLVALGKGDGIRGRVLDANGDDPGRYYVHAVEDEGSTTDPPRLSQWADIHPDGTFELTHLGDRRYNLLAGSDLLGFAFAPGVTPGEELTLTLRPASHVELTVVGPDLAKVPGARVVVSAIGGRKARGGESRSDAEGKVLLYAPAGSLEIKVVKDEDLLGVIRVNAPEGARIAVEVVLDRVR